jgi:hypothetical protein
LDHEEISALFPKGTLISIKANPALPYFNCEKYGDTAMGGTIQQSQTCPHCGTALAEPEWSESAGDQEVAYFWRCAACGNQFETRGTATRVPSLGELAEEFLPSLVIE